LANRLKTWITELYQWTSLVAAREVRTFTTRVSSMWRAPSHSWARSNYAYWRDVYYCRVPGLEISGLFLKPITQKIAAWVLGRAPVFKLQNKRSQAALELWWKEHHAHILQAFRFSLRQGDSFVLINPDLSVSVLPADTVYPIVDEKDYGKVIGWRVIQSFPHPDNTVLKMTVTDEYYLDRRIQTIEMSDKEVSRRIYRNLIGRLPIVHIANQPNDGEQFGHSEGEALVYLLNKYNLVMQAAVEGNVLQGRPTPIINFGTSADMSKFWTTYGSVQTIRDADGNTSEARSLSVDLSQILTLSNAEFKYESPGSFADDTEKLLGLMFYLILEHIELPEFVMGNAISGSKSSTETQMPIFETFIRMRQGDCATWVREIAIIALAYLSLVEPGVRVEEPVLQWHKISQNGRLTLDTLKWGLESGIIDRRTALILAPLEVENTDEVLDQAEKELDERMADEQKRLESAATVKRNEAPGADKVQEFDADELAELFETLEDK
jgi:hypothetical protein